MEVKVKEVVKFHVKKSGMLVGKSEKLQGWVITKPLVHLAARRLKNFV